MTLQSKLYPLLDDKSLLDNVSPNYRFMNRSLTNSIGEFYTGVRFSKSVRHRSNSILIIVVVNLYRISTYFQCLT